MLVLCYVVLLTAWRAALPFSACLNHFIAVRILGNRVSPCCSCLYHVELLHQNSTLRSSSNSSSSPSPLPPPISCLAREPETGPGKDLERRGGVVIWWARRGEMVTRPMHLLREKRRFVELYSLPFSKTVLPHLWSSLCHQRRDNSTAAFTVHR
jgi:hypothetical protein